jgi:hypothetical protein
MTTLIAVHDNGMVIMNKIDFRFRLQSLSRKFRTNYILQKRSRIDQERRLALEVLTSKIAHVRRERENTSAKQH